MDIRDVYRDVVRNLPNTSAMMFDLDLRFLFAEGPAIQQLFPNVDNFAGHTVEEVLPPELMAIFTPLQKRILAGESFNFEQTLPTGIYHAHAHPIRDEAGQIIGGVILGHDVAPEIRAESALRASESLFHSLVNLIPVGIIQTDTEGNRIFCNTTWCEMTGVTLEEALKDVNYGSIHPDDLPVASESWVRMMETDKPFQNAVFRYLRPDGKSVWVSGNGTPLRDEHGTVTGYLGSVTNISEMVNMQAALRENEARYRSVVNTMSEGVVVQALNGKVQTINPAAERIIGLTAQQITDYDPNRPRWPLIQGDGTPFPPEALPLAVTLETGESRSNVLIGMIPPDRSVRWISTNSRPLLDETTGRLAAGLLTMNDITDLHEAHARLQQERDLLRTVIDNTPEYIFLKGTDGRFLLTNSVYAKALGQSSTEDVIGKTVADFWPPEIAAQYQKEDEQVMWGGEPIISDERENSPLFGGHNFVMVTKVALRDSSGKTTGMLGVIRDITERRQMEDAIRQSEERLRLIADNIQDLVMQQTSDSIFVYVSESARAILGYEPSELIGTYGPDLVHPDDRDRMMAMGYSAFENGAKSVTLESRSRHKDGHYVPLESVTRFLYDEHGIYLGNVSISRDIAERNRLQDMALEREKLQTALEKEQELGTLRTRMMQRIAHEFRTPLTVIQSSVETMANYIDRMTPEQRVAKSDMIAGQIAWITDMLDQIGQVLQGNFKPDTLYRAQVDVSVICRQIAAELEAQFNRSGRFALDLPETAVISADPHVLKGALMRVMRNAARYSPVSEPIQVSLQWAENGLEFRITDHGVGILPEEQQRIFDPFFRGSNINEVGGLGVGLTLALAAIEAHDGTIAVESAPRQGTTVRIWLPASAVRSSVT